MFDLEIFIPIRYPFITPMMLVGTKIYHPNVDKIGRIYSDDWRPAISLSSWMVMKRDLLGHPNLDIAPDSPVTKHFKQDPVRACNKARDWTRAYAH